MRKYLPPPHKFRPKTLDSTDTVDFTHFRRTVNRYCGIIEFIKIVAEKDKMLGKSRVLSLTSSRLINSIQHGHSCKILYVDKDPGQHIDF